MQHAFWATTGISLNWRPALEHSVHTCILLCMVTSNVCGCFKSLQFKRAIFTLPCNQGWFLLSFSLPVISCYLLFYYVVVTSLYTWQLFSLWLISPPQHQPCYFRAMLGKHSHDGAWTPWPQAAKRLLTAHIAHHNYTSNKPRSICCRIQNHVFGIWLCYRNINHNCSFLH